ncbi:MAG: hypothetical protein Ct9H300mP28_36460 [Pseudomonadota bacterium]|nr:MAG: hypothetical protein Ct9H300mP28_36460 [Pseudomonadota bacterium]
MISLYIKRLSFGQVLSSFLLLFLVLLWIVPTVGLFVSSFRDKDQLAITGWWTAFQQLRGMNSEEQGQKMIRFN